MHDKWMPAKELSMELLYFLWLLFVNRFVHTELTIWHGGGDEAFEVYFCNNLRPYSNGVTLVKLRTKCYNNTGRTL